MFHKHKSQQSNSFFEEAQGLARNGFYREALDLYRQIWANEPNRLEALYGIAACMYRLGNLQQAERHLNQLLQRDADHAKSKQLLHKVREGLKIQAKKRGSLLDKTDETYLDEGLRDFPGKDPQKSVDRPDKTDQ